MVRTPNTSSVDVERRRRWPTNPRLPRSPAWASKPLSGSDSFRKKAGSLKTPLVEIVKITGSSIQRQRQGAQNSGADRSTIKMCCRSSSASYRASVATHIRAAARARLGVARLRLSPCATSSTFARAARDDPVGRGPVLRRGEARASASPTQAGRGPILGRCAWSST